MGCGQLQRVSLGLPAKKGTACGLVHFICSPDLGRDGWINLYSLVLPGSSLAQSSPIQGSGDNSRVLYITRDWMPGRWVGGAPFCVLGNELTLQGAPHPIKE